MNYKGDDEVESITLSEMRAVRSENKEDKERIYNAFLKDLSEKGWNKGRKRPKCRDEQRILKSFKRK